MGEEDRTGSLFSGVGLGSGGVRIAVRACIDVYDQAYADVLPVSVAHHLTAGYHDRAG